MQKKALLLCMVLLGSVLLTGCWDRKEINDVAFLVGTAIDKEPPDKFRISVQIPLPGQMGGVVGGGGGGGGGTSGDKRWYVDSVLGMNSRDAVAKLQRAASRQLYFGHQRVVVVGQDMAKNGVESILDAFARVPQKRLTAFMVVARGAARDVLNAKTPMEQFPSEMIRELAQSSMKKPRTLKHVIETMVLDGIDLALPVVDVYKTRPGPEGEPRTNIKIVGLAVFNKRNQLAGILTDEDASAVLLAMDQAKTPTLTIEAPKRHGEISVEFPETKSQVTPIFSKNGIIMRIQIVARGTITENESLYDTSRDANLSILEEEVAKKLKQNIEKTVKDLQTVYHSDPIGFGDMIYRRNPDEWQRLRIDWEKQYAQMKVRVEPMVHILHTGMATKPIGRRQGEMQE
ncbi:Ger(x)C family spore germination protein [Effusibacillus dendaii]|uniref:Putative spore germination protein YfkR n=1 Tax=Effusibacillus dendaii TaxID=2743772 RepID=A0A7I8DA77_9BACL|nr:Ger(x)C family spore germination protein [Effusibacillus dendaii]BCJ85869.1 putative spore germination protein YfkR [Effusibacillus dendaii]